MTDVIIFHFGSVFALLFLPKKSKLKKKQKKMPGDIIILHKCTSDDVQFLRYGTQQMDRQTDGKSDI